MQHQPLAAPGAQPPLPGAAVEHQRLGAVGHGLDRGCYGNPQEVPRDRAMNSPISPDVLLTGVRLLGWRTDTAAERERLDEDVRLLLRLQALTACESERLVS